jgi:integrase
MTTKQRADLTNQREVLAASKKDIDTIHNYLKKESSTIYADIWKIGVNLSLRIGDLLKIKFSDLNLTDRTLVLTEEKTGKSKTIRLKCELRAEISFSSQIKQLKISAFSFMPLVNSNPLIFN